MMDWDKVSNELSKPLSPDAIKPPPQGKYGEYVEALHVIREANRIFGFDGWNYSVEQLTQTNTAKQGEMHHVGYLAVVGVTIDQTRRSDVGHGQGHSRSEGDAHDSAVKEAVTDALKRALRTFGNTFGLALYEKDKSAREVGYETPKAVLEAVSGALDLDALQTIWKANVQWQKAPDFQKAKDTRKEELMKEAA